MKKPKKNRILSYKNRRDILNKKLTEKDKEIIDIVVRRVLKEYGETLWLLGRD